jgi:hypothetical protein
MKHQKWTEEEDSIIRQYYPAEGSDCVIRFTNPRAAYSVQRRATILGVKCNKKKSAWFGRRSKKRP